MSGLEKALFNLKVSPTSTSIPFAHPSLPCHTNPTLPAQFTAKQLNRQAAKASKDEGLEKAKLKKAIQSSSPETARIYAQNAIRKSNERVNLLRLASRLDAVASRVQTAVTMRSVTASMANVVKGMDGAMKAMDLEKISAVMDRFETQFEDLDVATGYYEDATGRTEAVGEGEDQVQRLMGEVADEAGVERRMEVGEVPEGVVKGKGKELEEDALEGRLRELRAPKLSSAQ